MDNNTGNDRYSAAAARITRLAERELDHCKALHYRFIRRLNRLSSSFAPEKLVFTIKDGERYYSEAWYEDGKRKTRYLGKSDNPVVREIQEKHFLEEAMPKLEKHIANLSSFPECLKHFDGKDVNESLPKTYRLHDDALAKLIGSSEEDNWYSKASKIKDEDFRRLCSIDDYYLAQYKHTAKDGTLMRSKSETQIANELINRGIPYIYEMPATIYGRRLHPDFSFYSYSRGKVMYWEHAGMMDDEKYRRDFAERLDLYIKGGYVPCVDVIFTFDTTGGDLDTRMIEAVIDEYI